MGLSSKHVSGDRQGFDWPAGKITLQSGAPELPQPPSVRRQQQSEPLKCPRCASSNTKFCYYNNYNKSQPRHLCKSCKRHWTKGGTLRTVPIGGGRKNKRLKISNAAKATTKAAHDHPNFPMSANSDFNVSAPQDPNTEYLFSNLSAFDMNTSFSDIFGHCHGNLDSVEESTIITLHNIPSSSSVPWPGPNICSSLDLPNYWKWNEIDVLTSSDHLDISWNNDDDDDDDGGGPDIKA